MSETRIMVGDVRSRLAELEANSVHCIVTSPPYWGLRDYGVSGQIGLESTFGEFIGTLVDVFEDVRRVLRHDGVCWVNMGDGYANNPSSGGVPSKKLQGSPHQKTPHGRSNRDLTEFKPKDLLGQPWRLAFAMQDAGWWFRSDCIWHKPNPMPESVTDRPTKAHEYVFLFAKSERYYFDADAVKEAQTESTQERAKYGLNGRIDDGSEGARTGSTFKRMVDSGEPIGTIPENGMRNIRTVWSIPTAGFSGSHFATFPLELARRCIASGSPAGGTVLDPFGGAGTTGLVAAKLGRNSVLIELNPEYVAMAEKRIRQEAGTLFNKVVVDAPREAVSQ